MPVELKDKIGIALIRVTSAVTRARVIVNDHSLEFPNATIEEIHLRHGKIISIGFDSEGFPLGKRESPVDINPIE